MGEYKHLKIQMYRVENCIALRVLEQTNIGVGEKWHSASCGFVIESAIKPEISKKALYIRGEISDSDRDMVWKEFGDKKEAKEMYQLIAKVVKEFNVCYSNGFGNTAGDIEGCIVGGE